MKFSYLFIIFAIGLAAGRGTAPIPKAEHIYVETQVPVCAPMPYKKSKISSAALEVAERATLTGR